MSSYIIVCAFTHLRPHPHSSTLTPSSTPVPPQFTPIPPQFTPVHPNSPQFTPIPPLTPPSTLHPRPHSSTLTPPSTPTQFHPHPSKPACQGCLQTQPNPTQTAPKPTSQGCEKGTVDLTSKVQFAADGSDSSAQHSSAISSRPTLPCDSRNGEYKASWHGR